MLETLVAKTKNDYHIDFMTYRGWSNDFDAHGRLAFAITGLRVCDGK